MSIKSTIVVTHGNEALQTVKDFIQKQASKPRTAAVALARFFEAAAIGNRACSFTVAVATTGVKASGTVTLSSIAAADTVTVGKIVFTGSDTPSGSAQFLTGSTDAASATSLAAKINAHTSLLGVVTASAALGVVTITAVPTGLIGNQVGIAISAHGSVSGAYLASGTNDSLNPVTYHCGV